MSLDDKDSQLMNYLVRMVVPMRREFGRQLDVHQFLHDFAYAREVLDEALKSSDSRLVEYARYVETRLNGPRIANATPAAAAAAPAAAVVPGVPDPPVHKHGGSSHAGGATAEEMRARILKKYTDGLR